MNYKISILELWKKQDSKILKIINDMSDDCFDGFASSDLDNITNFLFGFERSKYFEYKDTFLIRLCNFYIVKFQTPVDHKTSVALHNARRYVRKHGPKSPIRETMKGFFDKFSILLILPAMLLYPLFMFFYFLGEFVSWVRNKPKVLSVIILAMAISVLAFVAIPNMVDDGPTKATVERMVYITNTGEKYHEYGCRYLSQSCIKISYKKALSRGYDACSICH